ncbi:3598_t:CDS:1, partial [Acaulospora morrowiae]
KKPFWTFECLGNILNFLACVFSVDGGGIDAHLTSLSTVSAASIERGA